MATTTQQTAALTTSQPSALSATEIANPYALSANSPADLAKTAAGGMTQAATTGYNAADATATGYGTTNWNVEPEKQTVQGQTAGLIAGESPLMQLAQTQAKREMNQRGLLNSSMAVGAGQEAVIKQALPIATQDATLYANQAKYNADIANQQAQFKASAENQVALSNAAAKNAAANFEAAAKNTSSAQYAKDLNTSVSQMMDIAFKTGTANADNATKLAVQQLDADTRKYLIDTEATYKNSMQASASTNELYQQVTKNIADILANPDLDTKAKQAAVDVQKGYLNSGLQVLSATSGVKGLNELIDFTEGTGNTTGGGTTGGGTTGGGTTGGGTTGGETTGGGTAFKPPAALTAGANFQQVSTQYGNTLNTESGVSVDAKGAATVSFKDPITNAVSKFTLPTGSYYDPDKKQILDSAGKQVAVPSGLLSGAMSAEQRAALSPGVQAGDSPDELQSTFGPTGVNVANAKIGSDGSVTLKGGTVIPKGAVVVGDKLYKADGTLVPVKPADDSGYRDKINSAIDAGGANLDGATYNADGSVKLKNGTVIPANAYAKNGVLYDAKNKAITLKPLDVNGYEDKFRGALDQGGVYMEGATYDSKTGTMKLKSGTVVPAGAYIKDGKLVNATGAAIALKPNDDTKLRNATNDKWGGTLNMANVTTYNADGSFKLKSGTTIPATAVIKDGAIYAKATDKKPMTLKAGDK
jgi:hypothetical protein